MPVQTAPRPTAASETVPPPSAVQMAPDERRPIIQAWIQAHPVLSGRQAQSDQTMTAEFLDFLVANPAWFDLVRQYPLLRPAMEEVYPLLEHVELVDPEGAGVSRGVRAREAVGTILAAWSVIRGPQPDPETMRLFFPETLDERRAHRGADWNRLGADRVSPGLMSWLERAPLIPGSGEVSERAQMLRAQRMPHPRAVWESVLAMGERLSPDLVRRLETKADHQLFQVASAGLGAEAGIAMAHNVRHVLRRMCQQQVRSQTLDPKARRTAAQQLEELTLRQGMTESADFHQQPKATDALRIATVCSELNQISDAYRANPDAFHTAESFARWFEMADAWHRQLRDQDRRKQLASAWRSHTAFPEYPVEGYRARDLLIIPMRDNVSLALEGVVRKHCVGSYSHQCATGSSSIYSVRDGRGESIGTIEMYNQDWRVGQFRGLNNQTLSDAVFGRVKVVMKALRAERDVAAEVARAYETTNEAALAPSTARSVPKSATPRTLLLARIEAGLRSGTPVPELAGVVEALCEPEEVPGVRAALAARAADYVVTEADANALGTWRAAALPEADINGVSVDPIRLMIERLEARLVAGEPLVAVVEALQQHLPDEAEEYLPRLFKTAERVASTPAQQAAVERVRTEGQEWIQYFTTPPHPNWATRWDRRIRPRVERGALSGPATRGTPALTAAYVEEVLPRVREAQIRRALGENPDLDLPLPDAGVPKAAKARRGAGARALQ